MGQKTKHIKYIISSLLSFGFGNSWISLPLLFLLACNIPPGKQVYNAAFLMEKNEQFPLGWEFERGHPESIAKIAFPSIKKWKPEISAEIEHPVIFSQKIILEDSGSYQIFGKFRATIEKGSFFVSATSECFYSEARFSEDTDICKRVLFSIGNENKSTLTLRIGFAENSVGKALLDTLFTLREEFFYDFDIDPREMRRTISDIAGISDFDPSNFDTNVDRIAKSINKAFLEKEKPGAIKIAEIYGSELFDVKQTSYLNEFALDESVRDAYGPKSSLSLDEVLKLFRIPVRQLHLVRNCIGFHQFLEYWNPHDRKWKIIDIAFGIRYIDDAGEYLGFEELEKLVRENKFGASNIKVLKIGRIYYNEEEVMDGWLNAGLSVNIIKK